MLTIDCVRAERCRWVAPDGSAVVHRGDGSLWVRWGYGGPWAQVQAYASSAYALAYGIATLMTNLFGRGQEPFWQQASTNLVKFVILLHQILDSYVSPKIPFGPSAPKFTR